jgi:urease accessory protein UreH
VGGKTYEKSLIVKMDPRIKAPATVIAQEHALAVTLFNDIARDSAIVAQVRALQAQLRGVRDRANNATLTEAINAYDEKLNGVAGQGGGGGRRGGGGGRGRGGAGGAPTLSSINGELLSMLALLEEASVEPTTQALAAVRGTQRDFDGLVARWNALRTTELTALNAKLRAAGQEAVSVSP